MILKFFRLRKSIKMCVPANHRRYVFKKILYICYEMNDTKNKNLSLLIETIDISSKKDLFKF